MKANELKVGDSVWVDVGGALKKLTVWGDAMVTITGGRFGYSQRRKLVDGQFWTDETVGEERKRRAAKKRADAKVEKKRAALVEQANTLADELHAAGVSSIDWHGTKNEPGRVDARGRINVDLTVEQARALLAALKGVA